MVGVFDERQCLHYLGDEPPRRKNIVANPKWKFNEAYVTDNTHVMRIDSLKRIFPIKLYSMQQMKQM